MLLLIIFQLYWNSFTLKVWEVKGGRGKQRLWKCLCPANKQTTNNLTGLVQEVLSHLEIHPTWRSRDNNLWCCRAIENCHLNWSLFESLNTSLTNMISTVSFPTRDCLYFRFLGSRWWWRGRASLLGSCVVFQLGHEPEPSLAFGTLVVHLQERSWT